jgi:hypothetical protein
MDENKLTSEEVAEAVSSAEASGFPIPCGIVLATPFGVQALAAVQLGRNKGLIRDLNHCKELAGNAEELGKIIGNALAGVIAGRTAECACESVFSPPKPPSEPPKEPICHGRGV